ncbi:GIY-YIG nuclease family protein, partial [bacterium]|nr:GIY-YIG nuclease family protein [bacterium]
MNADDLRRLAPPDLPGVYLMRDHQKKIIYIGKAVSLSKRLASYFRASGRLDIKTRALVSRIKSLEYLVTPSEVEALVLENNLIKKHSPRYNILLRDDKNYPYLKLTVQEEYPRLLVTRRPFIDAARYFGPFPTASPKHTARLISRHFRLRLCQTGIKDHFRRKRPCLYLQMGQCDGICTGGVRPKIYARRVKAVIDFLEGGPDPISGGIRHAMKKASDSRQFESAALLRDQLDTLQRVRTQPVVSSPGREDRDILGLARSRGSATVE